MAVFAGALWILPRFHSSCTAAARLKNNVASTRIIFGGRAYQMRGGGGKVMEAFGHFHRSAVTSRSGLWFYNILVIINWRVITKGAGRIAEVGALGRYAW